MRPQDRKWFWIVTATALLLTTLLKLPTFELTHKEPDEVIYWTLAHSLLERGSYSLQGTQLLQILPAAMYDKPLFHHPPGFSAALVPFARANAWQTAIWLSWLGHALCVFAVAWVGRARMLSESASTKGQPSNSIERASSAPKQLWFWLPMLCVALDPLLLFLSRKLWIDALLAGLCSLSLALIFSATRPSSSSANDTTRPGQLLVGGLCLGLAGLMKLTGLLAVVPALYLLLSAPKFSSAHPQKPAGQSTGQTWRRLLWFGLPVAACMLPWFATFYAEFSTWLPWWSAPSQEMLTRDPYIARACARPWHYYLSKTTVVQPLFLLGLLWWCFDDLAARTVGPLRGLTPMQKRTARFAMLWLAAFLLPLTLVASSDESPFFLRYVAPAFPAIYVLLFGLFWSTASASIHDSSTVTEHDAKARPTSPFGSRARALVIAACAVYGLIGVFEYLSTSEGNEIASWLERWLEQPL